MTKTSDDKVTARRLWFTVTAAFLLLAAGWAALIVVAHRAKIESVPLVTATGKT